MGTASTTDLEELRGRHNSSSVVAEGEARQVLSACENETILGNLTLLALERQLEAAATPASATTAQSLRTLRHALHSLTLKMMIVRACFDLPLADDSEEIFASESQRRGRKMKHVSKNSKRNQPSGSKPSTQFALGGDDEQQGTAAAEAADVQANELL